MSEQTNSVDPNCVPRPYPSRTEPLPSAIEDVKPEWLSRTMSNKYPGVVARDWEWVQLLASHTTKWRLRVDWNEAGIAAGLPEHICLKSNWSGGFHNVDIHALEARFSTMAGSRSGSG